MDLTQLEKDLLGDLNQDSHRSWEVFEFVRLHHPAASDNEVFTIGRELIASWTERGWLRVSETSHQKSRTDSMAQLLNQHRPDGTGSYLRPRRGIDDRFN